MQENLINIITRASRKNLFERCYDSIQSQNYTNFLHIVTYETDENLKHFKSVAKSDNVLFVKVPHLKQIPNLYSQGAIHFPYELYMIYAEQSVRSGWIMYLDDDDILYDKNVLEKVNLEIQKFNEDTLHILRMKYNNNTIVPNDDHIILYKKGNPFDFGQIGTGCLLYHSKYKNYTYWTEWYGSDYKTAVSLRNTIPNLNITNIIGMKIISNQNFGKTDI